MLFAHLTRILRLDPGVTAAANHLAQKLVLRPILATTGSRPEFFNRIGTKPTSIHVCFGVGCSGLERTWLSRVGMVVGRIICMDRNRSTLIQLSGCGPLLPLFD